MSEEEPLGKADAGQAIAEHFLGLGHLLFASRSLHDVNSFAKPRVGAG